MWFFQKTNGYGILKFKSKVAKEANEAIFQFSFQEL